MPRRGQGTRGARRGRGHARGVRELNRPLVAFDELSEFELERQQRIAHNMVRMEQHYSDLPMFHLPTDPLFRHFGNMGNWLQPKQHHHHNVMHSQPAMQVQVTMAHPSSFHEPCGASNSERPAYHTITLSL